MKILHLTGKDFYGAGRAAYRLHCGLRNQGVDSLMFVGDKHTDDDSVVNIQSGAFNKWTKKLLVRSEKSWLKKYGGEPRIIYSTGVFALSIYRKVMEAKPDMVHVHWINRGFMNIEELERLKVPVVISMHDMWYYTGGCHYVSGCLKYQDKCGACHHLGSTKVEDASTLIQERKRKVYGQVQPTFIAPSQWMKKEAQSSTLLRDYRIENIPSGIDISGFKHREGGREKLGIAAGVKLVLFAAVDATSDLNKGFDLLMEAFGHLKSEAYEFLIIGGDGKSDMAHRGFKVHNLGYVDQDDQMIEYLSAADVVVVPSRSENLSNMIMEALSCATPVVGFRVGGNSDMVEHEINGYLAAPFESKDLAHGIEWCVESKERNEKLSASARATVEKKFNLSKISKEYIGFYEQVIKGYDK